MDAMKTAKKLNDIINKKEIVEGPACPFTQAECSKGACSLWLDEVYTTEGLRAPGRCALKFIAERDSEGRLIV